MTTAKAEQQVRRMTATQSLSRSRNANFVISICRGCSKQKRIAKESRLCSDCAWKAINNLLRFITQTVRSNNA